VPEKQTAGKQEFPMSQVALGRGAGANPGARPLVRQGERLAAIARGAGVLTLEGLLAVEHLAPGDRIVTRAGAVRLAAVQEHRAAGPMICVAPGCLGHDRSGQPLLLSPETKVLLRDWRARAMFGKAQVMVAISKLVDGAFIRRVAGAGLPLFALSFDAPQVIYVDGVQLGCPSSVAGTVAA
jgi:hypothetical protein